MILFRILPIKCTGSYELIRDFNGVSLAHRSLLDIEWLVALWFFRGSWPVFQSNPCIYIYNRFGLDRRAENSVWNLSNFLSFLSLISNFPIVSFFSSSSANSIVLVNGDWKYLQLRCRCRYLYYFPEGARPLFPSLVPRMFFFSCECYINFVI